ncbi:unnamed protein product, partial [Porites lobata]
MEENTSGLKFARVIAVAHIIVGVFLFVLGLTDRLHGDSWTGKLGFGIWCGLWMCITGGLGILASKGSASQYALAGTFMGFTITSTVFGGVVIICYGFFTAFLQLGHHRFNSEIIITLAMMILGIIEFSIGIAGSFSMCSTICNCCGAVSDQSTSVMYVAGQGVVPGGYVIAEGPGGVPMAFPVQQTEGGVTVPHG